MIKASDAVKTARSLLGTPYTELDCINFIKAVIRRSPGGRLRYTTAGTNTLWDSINKDKKYRDLTTRHHGIKGAKAGMLAFKIGRKPDGMEDVHHVGLVTGDGTVIHSSGPRGPHRCVVETPLDDSWDALAIHRYIQWAKAPTNKGKKESPMLYKAKVITKDHPLRLRRSPETGDIIAHISIGETVDVMHGGSWPKVEWTDTATGKTYTGYVSGEFIQRIDASEISAPAPVTPPMPAAGYTLLQEASGQTVAILGDWKRLNKLTND